MVGIGDTELSLLEPVVHKASKRLETTQVWKIKDLTDRWRLSASSGHALSFVIREGSLVVPAERRS